MISLDASASMLAEDFKPNRFEAAKKVAIQFAKDRPNDQLGLVVFEGAAYTPRWRQREGPSRSLL